MALFSSKKKTAAKAVNETETKSRNDGAVSMKASIAHVLRHGRITEKATEHALRSAYVFEVSPTATKREVISAVYQLYQVIPRTVRMAKIPAKSVRSTRTGKHGVKKGGKKAYVYLKKGETISIV